MVEYFKNELKTVCASLNYSLVHFFQTECFNISDLHLSIACCIEREKDGWKYCYQVDTAWMFKVIKEDYSINL